MKIKPSLRDKGLGACLWTCNWKGIFLQTVCLLNIDEHCLKDSSSAVIHKAVFSCVVAVKPDVDVVVEVVKEKERETGVVRDRNS